MKLNKWRVVTKLSLSWNGTPYMDRKDCLNLVKKDHLCEF